VKNDPLTAASFYFNVLSVLIDTIANILFWTGEWNSQLGFL